MKSHIIKVSAASSIGHRDKNQDVFLIGDIIGNAEKELMTEETEETTDKLRVYAICDGIGMFDNSKEAGFAALEAVKNCVSEFSEEEGSLEKWIQKALIEANRAVTTAGTTIVLFAVYGEQYAVANIGDSPAFIVSNEEITELSTRHNLATLKMLWGQTPTEEDERVLLHYLGPQNRQKELTYDVKSSKIMEDSRILLCSDGVTKAFSEEEIKTALSEGKTSAYFVEAAVAIENSDNCTAIVINVKA